ncbi:MAG: aminodeoxychorismate lyase [Actinomycetia bacterium]|nr:aminodeoxychorismate lyase [Actinomycetes bacterium]
MSGRYPGDLDDGAADDPRASRNSGGYSQQAYGPGQGEQWPGEQGYGYSEQGYPQDYGQAGDPRQGDPRQGNPRAGHGGHGYAGDGRSRRDGGVWGADAPLPPTTSRETVWGERPLPPHDSFPPRVQPGREPLRSGPNQALPADSAYQSGPWRARRDGDQPGRDADAFPRGQNRGQAADPPLRSGPQPVQPGREQQRGGRPDGTDQRGRESFSSGPQWAQPGRSPRLSGPQQVPPDSAARGSAQYGFPEYGSSRHGTPQHTSPRHSPPRHSGPSPQQDGRRAAHRDTGGYQMANDYPDGDFVPGFGVPSSDRDYGRDPDRDNRREDPRRGPGRDRYGDDDRYSDDRQVREDRYADDRYADDRYGGTRPGDGPRGGDWRAGGNERARYDDDEDRQPRRRRGKARRLAPWIALLVLVVLLIPLVGGGLYAYNYLQAKNHPPDYTGAGTGPQVTVQVMSGDTATSLAQRLVTDGVVKSNRAFILAAENSTNTTSLEAGFFQMNQHMQASLAYAYLINPKDRIQHEVTLPEELRVSDTLIRLSKGSGIPLADFQAVLKNQVSQLALPPYAKNNPEGYLFPATYPIVPHETALAILQAMVNRFAQEAQSVNLPASVSMRANGGTVHLTTGQIIIVASLIQAEAGRVQDMPRIAEVVYNRLKIGMPLKFDSTVFYGLGKYGTSASLAEINTPGPYNTYLNKGLPPTPIESPGDAAIRAALHPATGSLLYFLGCKNGTTVFSSTQPPPSSSC